MIAPANAFVLLRWSALLVRHFAFARRLWDALGRKMLIAMTNTLDTIQSSSSKGSLISAATHHCRRAIRTLAKAEFGHEALYDCIKILVEKQSVPAPKHALTLGIIAGVCKQYSDLEPMMEEAKQEYISFYLREVLGSRVQLPQYLAKALHSFFRWFVTLRDLKTDLIPGVEKALLRAPEIALDGLVAPMLASLSETIDLSEILVTNLLKPLLSNVKSTNPLVRNGSLHTFEVCTSKSKDEDLIEKAADEILAPLKANKVTAAEQRVTHASMLTALNLSTNSSRKIQQGLVALAAKEANEAAAAAEIQAIGKCVAYSLTHDVKAESVAVDAFVKGTAEKRIPIRRLWSLELGHIIWSVTTDALDSEGTIALVDSCLGNLIGSYNDVVANPIPASQNGQASIACMVVALVSEKVPMMHALKASSLLKKANIIERALALEPKPSFLLSARVYSKTTAEDDLRWLQRALAGVFSRLVPGIDHSKASVAWAQATIYLVVAANVPARFKIEAADALKVLYVSQPNAVGATIIAGLWQWCEDVELDVRESAAVAAKTGRGELHKAVRAICVEREEAESLQMATDTEAAESKMAKLLVLCRPSLIPHAPWIELCLRTGVDPGSLAAKTPQACLNEVVRITEEPKWTSLPAFHDAAFSAAAELAFVAPNEMTPILVRQIADDLDPLPLERIGPMEAAIYRTPEGTPFIDVLSKQPQSQQISKNAKDYDTLKWEEDLRAQLDQKKGQTKKLTQDEQAKVSAQLAKERDTRREVAIIDARLHRGVGIVVGLANGPPTDAEAWFGPSVRMLFDAIQAGAGLLLGDTAALAYLQCADRIAARLGPMRRFIGVATLRAAGVTILPENLLAEPLGDLVTRVLYRLRSLGEQRPFDPVTLSYILALTFLVLDFGGIDRRAAEDVDEQLLLAIEILTFHTETCSDIKLPRQRLLNTCITAMQRYNQHFRPLRDCFTDLCRHIAPNIVEAETNTIVKGTTLPDQSVRGAVLSAISAELELADREFYVEIWIARYDDVAEHVEIAQEIWEENELKVVSGTSAMLCLPYLRSKDAQLRRAASRAVAAAVQEHPGDFQVVLNRLKETYLEAAETRRPELDRYGMPIKKDMTDPWEARQGVALTFKELAELFPSDELVAFMRFLIEAGPLGDKSSTVRDDMTNAATAIATVRGHTQVESLMELCEITLSSSARNSQTEDLVNEAVVIVYGALAQHLPAGDDRVSKVVQRLFATLSTPSESVQFAVAQCLPPLVRASSDKVTEYVQQLLSETLHGKKYAARRGAAYGLAGVVKGKGISILRSSRVLSTLRGATENKKDPNERQGAFLAYELLSYLLGRVFEPYIIQIVPQLLAGFGDASADVRDACLDAAKTCFASLSSFGVKRVLPTLLEGLREQQWRSKKGASDSLGAMAYLDPEQLAISLPDIIPPLTEVLNDSHKEVRFSANRSLQRFGDVISNPEVKSQVNILLKALSDPTKYTDDALDALIKVNFIHYLDAPSLALVVRILERGLSDRSATKRKAAQIIGSLAHLTERRDLITHLPPLVAGLRVAIVDPVPTTRATASKALGSTIEKLGEDALPDLIPSLMQTLKSDTGAGDRLGSAQALSEVLAGLGTTRLEETLPTVLQNVTSSKASVREGFMSLFIFLPACFGQSFANYLAKIIPPILAGLADDIESIRETALRAGQLLVKSFASRSVDLLLPELERGLADDSYRIRLSSVKLVGDLLFNLTGISGKTEQDEDVEENANEAGASLLEVLGEEKRNKVLSALYICRCDTSGLVRTEAIAIWKALVSTPRTLRELVPTLTQLLIRRLASSNMEQKVIAGNSLGELIRKSGEGVLATLLPTLEEGLQTSTDPDARQGICIALRELVAAASQDALDEYEKTLIAVIRTALVDPNEDVRESAAEAFDSLQRVLGKRIVDQVLPHLLNLLRTEDEKENALAALLTLLTETSRSSIIIPTLLPPLLTSPISAFNVKALASLAEVASSSMTRKLPTIFNALMDNIIKCKDESLKAELNSSFDAVLLSVDEFDGLNTMMSCMLGLVKNDDHLKRAAADLHMAKFFESAEIDYSRYYPDLIRAFLIAFDDRDTEVVRAAWTALSALTLKMRKEEMESLVTSTRQTLLQVGVAGHNLPGFSLPKGINAVFPIFYQGLMNGSAEQRTQAALAISDLVDRTSAEGLKPFVTQITGPLIRVVSERSTDLRAAILLTLNNLLEKIPTLLKPFLPQLQRTFTKSLADTSSDLLRSRAAKALGTLITMAPRIDPLIAELVTGSKTTDSGVRNTMLEALFKVVSKAGANMNDTSRNSILGLIDSEAGDASDALNITYAKLLGALIKVLQPDAATGLIKSRVLTSHFTHQSVLGLNAVLLESPTSLTASLDDATRSIIVQGIGHSQPFVSTNCVLAAGKYLLTPSGDKSFEATRAIAEALADVIPPGGPVDTRRLALVVVRTVSREHNELIRPHLVALVPPIFASARDTVIIPVKLSAEAAFLAVFNVVDEDSVVFDKYMAGPGAELQPALKRSMQEYFKRIAVRLSNQAKERRDAQGGQGGLGLDSDEASDLREVMSIGKVDLEEGSFSNQ